jgi:hypothetical protein
MSTDRTRTRARSSFRRRGTSCVLALGAFLLIQPLSDAAAFTNPAAPSLGLAAPFGVLAGAGVTNSGNTVIDGDLGTSPTPAITGFPPGTVTPPGAIHAADATADNAQLAAGNAYGAAASASPDIVFAPVHDLGGETYTAGVYNDPSSLAITGTVTLDAENNPDAVFIFQAGSTLVTSGASNVALTNGAQACNVFWQVGSSATLGASSTFNGTILAAVSAQLGEGVTVQGRVLASSASVTLLNDHITVPSCAPSSGVSQNPLFGQWGVAVVLAAFLGSAGVLVVRRRTRPEPIH